LTESDCLHLLDDQRKQGPNEPLLFDSLKG
jgi:hypothetical protein